MWLIFGPSLAAGTTSISLDSEDSAIYPLRWQLVGRPAPDLMGEDIMASTGTICYVHFPWYLNLKGKLC